VSPPLEPTITSVVLQHRRDERATYLQYPGRYNPYARRPHVHDRSLVFVQLVGLGTACCQRGRPRTVVPRRGRLPALTRRLDGRPGTLTEEIDLLGAPGVVVEDTLQAVMAASGAGWRKAQEEQLGRAERKSMVRILGKPRRVGGRGQA